MNAGSCASRAILALFNSSARNSVSDRTTMNEKSEKNPNYPDDYHEYLDDCYDPYEGNVTKTYEAWKRERSVTTEQQAL